MPQMQPLKTTTTKQTNKQAHGDQDLIPKEEGIPGIREVPIWKLWQATGGKKN